MYFTKTTSKFTQAGLKLEFGFPKIFPGLCTYFFTVPKEPSICIYAN